MLIEVKGLPLSTRSVESEAIWAIVDYTNPRYATETQQIGSGTTPSVALT